MWLSRREWLRHCRELARAERRAASAENFSRDLVNRWLTSHGSMGIAHTPVDAPSVATEAPARVAIVGGITEQEFIDDLLDAGLDIATAKSRWKQAQEVGVLPYQMEGELPS